MKYYQSKAKDSFRTKFNIYLFKYILYPNETPLDVDAFINYKIDDEIVKLHTTKYWQLESGEKLTEDRTIKEVEAEIMRLKKSNQSFIKEWEKKYVTDDFPRKFKKEIFDKIREIKQCAYCGITVDQINLLIDNGLIYKKRL